MAITRTEKILLKGTIVLKGQSEIYFLVDLILFTDI